MGNCKRFLFVPVSWLILIFSNGFYMVSGDVTSDLNYFEVKETSKTIDILCRTIFNNSKRDQLVEWSLAKDGHEDNSIVINSTFTKMKYPLSAGFELSVHNTNGSEKLITKTKGLNRIFR